MLQHREVRFSVRPDGRVYFFEEGYIMCSEQWWSVIWKIAWGVAFLACTIVLIVLHSALDYGLTHLILYLADVFLFAFFICALLISCKRYEYNGNEIVVYAGMNAHYIKVNGEKTDQHSTMFYITPIYLSCTLDDGTNLKATISVTNRIALKINDKLVQKRR